MNEKKYIHEMNERQFDVYQVAKDLNSSMIEFADYTKEWITKKERQELADRAEKFGTLNPIVISLIRNL